MNKSVKVSDDTYDMIQWLAGKEKRTRKAIVDLAVFNWLGERYKQYIKSKGKT